jgi:ectoine hydroxylase-related dioxygenase (phytanoyl-CoA dioxygenase family)
VIGQYTLLHLQNAIVNRPDRPHHQSIWHRDLPYLDRTSSRPLALSALFCVDDFSVESGGTSCVPGSHLIGEQPPDTFLAKHAVTIEADAGDVIVFDSMLLHRAGINRSSALRRAVNNVYSVGIIRQQIDLPRALAGRYADDPALAILLGYDSSAPASAEAYRLRRMARLEPR